MPADINAEIEILRAGCPGLRIETAVEDASGQFNRVIWVSGDNGEWIFRFPRYPRGIDALEQETYLLQALRGQLPLPIPNPVYTCFEPRVPGRVFVGYRRLPGEPLYPARLAQVRDEAQREKLAAQLADFLRSLHRVPLEGQEFPTADRPEAWAAMYERIRRELFPAMRAEARQQVVAHFEAYLADRARADFLPALRHGDFGGSNIIYDAAAGQISGVIDFSFCAPGDPAVDLAAVSTLGADFYARLLPKYAPDEAVREGLAARASFYRGTFALQEALAGLDEGDEQAYRNGMAEYR